ncbi:MAG: penicillin-binding protein 1C [Magnetococcales bacterium]|nr:penicillin-binding protein 1C [Magnetococcales bacterium]
MTVGAFLLGIMVILDYVMPLPVDKLYASGTTVVTDRHGEPLRLFADNNGVWRYPVRLDQVSPYYIDALINYEDRWFWNHPGINPFSLLRALYQWIDSGRVVSGGSTLTMQLARIIDPHERSITGKIKQLFRATQLSWHLNRKQILTHYINHAPFGGPFEGVEAASRVYLGKSAQNLSQAEAALLAVLPQAPSRLRPDRHPENAQKARNKVLNRLDRFTVWPAKEIAQARNELVYALQNTTPHHAPLLTRHLKKIDGRSVIHTTLDGDLQALLSRKINDHAHFLPPKTSMALLMVENETMVVHAYRGSADFTNQNRFGHVDMVRAVRSPGSLLKPFLYGLALDDGLIHSHSLLTDAPQDFQGYRPNNFHVGFQGPVSMTKALQNSLNVPAVSILDHIGSIRFSTHLRRAGLRLRFPGDTLPNLALILGGAGTTLEELVPLYAALARDGQVGTLRYLPEQQLIKKPLLSPGAAWIIRRILSSAPTPPGIPERYLPKHQRIAWKTGTSYGYRDAWAIGVTDRYTLGVWVGRPDGVPIPGQYGAITAAPFLFNILQSLPEKALWNSPQPPPETVTQQEICWPLGTAPPTDQNQATTFCHQRHKAWILNGVVPPTLPDRFEKHWISPIRTIAINPDTGRWVPSLCPVRPTRKKNLVRWPTLLHPWLNRTLRQQQSVPRVDHACKQYDTSLSASFKITGLNPDTILRPAGSSTILPPIQLSVLGAIDTIYWLINGKMIKQTEPNTPLTHQFNKSGRFEISAMDAYGHHDTVTITINLE